MSFKENQWDIKENNRICKFESIEVLETLTPVYSKIFR